MLKMCSAWSQTLTAVQPNLKPEVTGLRFKTALM